ncbi:tRNA-i(6)A37 modification enzyme MiaB [Ehrlichia chaffeensis str. Arkansas]|uniref:tRNA-2-methylthio-N(6)-dimethylallyladenosine synthase n=1 Tax=Ehrlichia chaffeensis (strain ATCC CRL-10679 / Arkansas) TaxID=205920 RepID=MIAB_EHRCR|nr:tRNA (N6-isopentenyl adenosine(37)-C2)-methylthiotransferase MiaB [Ehrlichia chaffeensis]Q2GG00.1 RecName: Full=tRNA-2-methylthio-N(6)-dimethylallyladenosine synthase; AltName: Full=(Dimethylallyl)adenosine tRNA methylthiotransferase MiaB; AltName: Full=tRNA-i(6)A37 methylthiotransferase [Ehrlichia chaffeensis str. Arkansas]ABD45127.1 tRNA-i(6)A37 modification enzyme MiaB [Ehrlichia chaffeensis str. Arkansas]
MQGLYIKSYGCQMNVYDSLIMENIIKPLGFTVVNEPSEANIVILNTCHIREKASEKLYSELGKMRKIQETKDLTIVVAGCVAQAEGEQIFARAPFVDIVVGPQSIHTLPELIIKARRMKKQVINIDFPIISKFDAIPVEEYTKNQEVSAFISVQEGCNKFCTFCVVPYTRGEEYSRTVEAIFNEALVLSDSGVKEITLIGQNVNAYHGTYKGCEWDLGKLIQYLAKIPNIERIRYTTSHPRDMHQSLYEAHRSETKLMPFVHLPIQSGSDRILKKMNRKHTAEEYIDIINNLRKQRPDIAFSSDFIVGFPGETEEDFEHTMKLVQEVNFSQAYSFKYSPRPGTPSAEYPNQIPEEIKSQRIFRLQELLREQQLAFNRNMIGQTCSVLFNNKKGKFDNQIIGKTEYMQSCYINTDNTNQFYNSILPIKIIDAYQNSVTGIVVN